MIPHSTDANSAGGERLEAGAPATAAAPSLVVAYGQRIARVLRANLHLVIVAALASGLIGWAVGKTFDKLTWEVNATVSYKESATSDQGRYGMPTFDTHDEDIRSIGALETICQEFKLTIPPRRFRDFLELNAPRNTRKVIISFKWANKTEAVEILDRLLALFLDRVKLRRQEALAKWSETVQTLIRGTDEELAAAQKTLRQKTGGQDLRDLRERRDQLRKDLALQEKAIDELLKFLNSSEAQVKSFSEAINARQELLAKEKKGKNPAQEMEPRIKEGLVAIEGKIRLAEQESEKLGGDYRRLRGLGEAIARKEVDDAYFSWQRALANLNNERKNRQALLDEAKRGPRGAGDRDGLLDTMLGERVKAEAAANGYRSSLADSQKKLTERVKDLQQLEETLKKIDSEATQVNSLEKLREGYAKELDRASAERASPDPGVEIASPPTPIPDPVKSTRRNLMVVGAGLPMVLFLVVLLGYDLLFNIGTITDTANRLGLPILGRVPVMSEPRDEKRVQAEARALGLRLRQYVPDKGSVLMFTSVSEGTQADEIVAAMSRFLAMRDERVLLMDARFAEVHSGTVARLVDRPEDYVPEGADKGMTIAGSIKGLAQFLVFKNQDPKQFIFPTRLPGVDCLPSGAPYPSTDILATKVMQELLAKLAKKYTLILLLAPPITQGVDAEILAAYAHGIVVVVNGPVARLKPITQLVRSLKEAQAPLLGAVIC